MEHVFIKQNINIKDIPKESPFPIAFIENNEKQINEISNFFQSDKKIFLINGFKGSGKTMLANFVTSYLADEVIKINYTCFETTILDDMLLAFFGFFKKYAIEGKISTPKMKVENFTQKINSYFNSINSPIVVILDSFDAVLKDNKPDILNFIKHISMFENVKIIITSTNFGIGDFSEVNSSQTTVLAFSKDLFEKFLKSHNIKNIGPLSNELYKQTKGYFNLVNLSVRIMKVKNLSLAKFLEVFSKSYTDFVDFILREALSLVDPVSLHLFRLLAVVRIPIHINLLKTLKLYNQERIVFFVFNSLLHTEGESLYLPDYLRALVEHQIQDSVILKLHKACIALYETQLPLKPMERDLILSRQTMRNEIEYHSLFIPKKVVLPAKIEKHETLPPVEVSNITEETKEEKVENINFIIEDADVLSDIADSIKDYIVEKQEQNNLAIKSNELNLLNILNNAKEEEAKYNFKNAIILYQSALTKKNDENYDKFLPTVYLKLGKIYKQLSKWFDAIEYYTKAQDFYYNSNETDKVNSIKLEIANIYFLTYKQENARYILNELDKTDNLSNNLRIKVNIALGKISNNIDDEYNYYKKSLDIAEEETDKSLKAELYYLYAAVNDEKNEIKTAAAYYIKCCEVSNNPKENKYLSKSLANLAELCEETGNVDSAVKYYKKSIEIDKNIKNYNGLYSSFRHLSEIFAPKDESQSLEYLLESLEYSKLMHEPYYEADSNLEVGNFYLLRKDYKKAEQYFNNAYEIAKTSFTQDNIQKLLSKIEYLKGLANG